MFKQFIKSIPLIGWFTRWTNNLLRLNNLKYIVVKLQETQQQKHQETQQNLQQLEQKHQETQQNLQQLEQKHQETQQNLQQLEQTQQQKHQETQQNLQQLQEKITTMLQQLQTPDIPNAIEIEAPTYIQEHKKPLYTDNNTDLYYTAFENVFYNHTVVLQKQKVYLHLIPDTKEHLHLDIGCGRGEFLTLLQEKNIKAKGIDINALTVKKLQKEGFDVKQIDMLTHLKETQETYTSISAIQMIEHITYEELHALLRLAHKRLTAEGLIILETINPHNAVAFNSFYMDETHKRPLPPEMLTFMLEYHGFTNIKIIYTSPMPPEFRSKEHINMNYHDYTLIGYKK